MYTQIHTQYNTHFFSLFLHDKLLKSMYLSCHVQVSGEDGQSVSEVRVVSTSLKECLFGEGCFFSKALSSTKKKKINER